MTEPRFLLQITEGDRWSAVLSNVGNLVDAGHASRTTVVANGTALFVLQADNALTAKLAQAVEGGVVVNACRNAMAKHEVSADSLRPWVGPVESALLRIAALEAAEAIYVKP